jgi:hypothetical protein
MPHIRLIIGMLFIFASCKNSNQHAWNELPGVTPLTELQQTAFVPTLESPVEKNKNIVYAAAFLYAWDKFRQKIGPVQLNDHNSTELRLVNQSGSYKNTLTEGEYTTEEEINDSLVIVRAFFNKTLPFPAKLQKLDPISFNGTKVPAFGMTTYDLVLLRFTKILYYKDDDHFILSLTPKDDQHEIQLIKGVDEAGNLSGFIQQANDMIELGKKESGDPRLSWKYSINDIDLFMIPKIQFNIDTRYPGIERQVFKTYKKSRVIVVAYQRTGFILNENGAVAESEAIISTTDSTAAEPVKILPKKMVFDKPFLVVIKRTKSANPYFVMWIRNEELLLKE